MHQGIRECWNRTTDFVRGNFGQRPIIGGKEVITFPLNKGALPLTNNRLAKISSEDKS